MTWRLVFRLSLVMSNSSSRTKPHTQYIDPQRYVCMITDVITGCMVTAHRRERIRQPSYYIHHRTEADPIEIYTGFDIDSFRP
jgi:hypothetical protein